MSGVDAFLQAGSPDQPASSVDAFLQATPAAIKSEPIDPTEGMSGFDKFVAGYGKAAHDLVLGTKQALLAGAGSTTPEADLHLQQLRDQLTQQVDQEKTQDAPLMKGWGRAGHIVGSITDTAPLALIPGANTILGSGAIGAGLGAVNPTGQNDSRLQNMALGGVTGMAIPAALKGLGMAGNKISDLVGQYTDQGSQRLAAQKLQELAGGAENLAGAENYTPATQGIRPTLAEATLNPGIASTELARSSDPVFKTALRGQQDANKLTMINLLDQMRGSPADMDAAIAARRQATAPLYAQVANSDATVNATRAGNLIDRLIEANPANKALTTPLNQIRESLFQEFPPDVRASEGWAHLNDIINSKTLPQTEWNPLTQARTIMYRMKTGAIDPDEAIDQLKGLQGFRQSTNDSLDYIRQLVKQPDYVLHDSPQALKSAMDNINSMLADPANSTVKRALTLVKNSLGHQINKVEPAYGQANQTFAQMSAPINQMQVADALYNKFVPALTESGLGGGAGTKVRADAYAAALRNAGDSVKSMTGRNMALEDVMTPTQLNQLKGIQSDLARSAQADALGASKGSATNQNEVLNQIVGSIANKIPGGNAVLGIGKAVMPESKVNQRLAEMLLNPQAYAQGSQLIRPPSSLPAQLGRGSAPLIQALLNQQRLTNSPQ